MSSLVNDANKASLKTLANAVELGQCILSKVAGGDISNHIAGQPATPTDFSEIITAKLQSKLAKYLGEA